MGLRRKRGLAALVAGVLVLLPGGAAAARSILFVGNSFTYGQGSPVRRYHPERVNDLNREDVGGVPALFRTFADETGGGWTVSLETAGGQDLAFHLDRRAIRINRAWDVVLLQGYSTLDASRPGDPVRHAAAARALGTMFLRANPKVRIHLISTWSRADLAWNAGTPWSGKPIGALGEAVDAANRQISAGQPGFGAPVPVGAAWLRAMERGLADPNPYDGVSFGQFSLWTWDHYHASTEGYYLSALTIFGAVTGIDPRVLGAQERAADDLGMNPAVTLALQNVAAATLGLPATPPATTRKPPEPLRKPLG